MRVDYFYPSVWVDGFVIGDLQGAVNGRPELSDQIFAAVDRVMRSIDINQVAELQQQIVAKDATIAHLTARLQALAPNLAEILPALLEAGLTAWSERSIAAYHPGEDTVSIVPEIAKLFALAEANQVAEVRQVFVSIVLQTKITPTPEESAQLQAVLDSVRFPIELLGFHPWMHPKTEKLAKAESPA